MNSICHLMLQKLQGKSYVLKLFTEMCFFLPLVSPLKKSNEIVYFLAPLTNYPLFKVDARKVG